MPKQKVNATSYQESKGAVKTFLLELNRILNSEKSNLRISAREDKLLQYSTRYCMQTLKFTAEDVKNELKKLTVDCYVETLDDERNIKSNKYYVFYKQIKGKYVYIKVKIESYDQYIVFCISFHFPEYPITNLPYK